MNRSLLRLAFPALVVALAWAAPAAAAPRRDTSQPYRSLDVLAEVLAYIQNSYVEELKEKDLVQSAVEGMVQRLDPHSMILRPEVYRAMRDETSGEFDGVGLEVIQAGDEIVVVSPLADSPAERAGILPGDRIVAIDGAATKDMPIGEATRRMKGTAGTKVVVSIARAGASRAAVLRPRARPRPDHQRRVAGHRQGGGHGLRPGARLPGPLRPGAAPGARRGAKGARRADRRGWSSTCATTRAGCSTRR